MKVLIFFILLILLLVTVTSCSIISGDCSNEDDVLQIANGLKIDEESEDEYEVSNEVLRQSEPFSQPTIESSIPIEVATRYFAMLDEVFSRDDGALWGANLNAPLMFIDAETRDAVANQAVRSGDFVRQGDVYVGSICEHLFIGNTIMHFGDELWATLLWQNMLELSDYGTEKLRIMVHETFHVSQPSLFGASGSWFNHHVSYPDARISVALELNALMIALNSNGVSRENAIHYALSIRYERKQRFPTHSEIENRLEVMEGLAVYTEFILNYDTAETRNASFNNFMETFDIIASANLFGYASGALYGFLLDDFCGSWRKDVDYTTDLSGLLKSATGITELTAVYELNLEQFNFSTVVDNVHTFAEEEVRDFQLLIGSFEPPAAQSDALRLLANYPVLRIPLNASLTITSDRGSIDGYGFTIHPFISLYMFSDFGTLASYDGVIIKSPFQGIFVISAVDMVVNESVVSSGEWTIELNEGFEIQPLGRNYWIISS